MRKVIALWGLLFILTGCVGRGNEILQPSDILQQSSNEQELSHPLGASQLTSQHSEEGLFLQTVENDLFYLDPTLVQYKLSDQVSYFDFDKATIQLAGQDYPLQGSCFQTLQKDVHALTEQEEYVVDTLLASFQQSAKMQEHMQLLLDKGSMYLVYNQHLLFHGCLPLKSDGSFLPLTVADKDYSGKELLNFFEEQIRSGCQHQTKDSSAADWIWYCWTGKISPQFGKSAMTTFERYFIADKKTHKEIKNPYYHYRDTHETCQMILEEFALYSPHSRIINGHTPVKVKGGESPIKGEGMLFVDFLKPTKKQLVSLAIHC